MFRAAAALSVPFQPFSPAAQTELGFMSGLDGSGNVDPESYWSGYWISYPYSPPPPAFPHKWSPTPGYVVAGAPGGVVDYSFAPGWSAADENTVIAGLALWSAVANIQFVQVGWGSPSQVTFIYNANGVVQTGTSTGASPPSSTSGTPGLGQTTGVTVQFDPYQVGISPSAFGSFTAFGGYGIDTVIHEEGHLLGLGHAGPYNGSADPMTDQLGPYDTRQWSLMSYIDPWDPARYTNSQSTGTYWGTGSDGYYREPTTWMPLDILAAQRLYGVASSTPLSGGQIFGFHCNIAGPIEPFFDFSINAAPVVTLWDAGLGNTLDVSGFSAPALVDLRSGAFSSVDGMTNNIAIAFGTAIDNAVGGPGDTTFVVNGRSDSIVGGGGNDTVVFTNGGGNYSDSYAGPARLVDGGGADDTLVNIGSLAFLGGASTIASNVGGSISLAGGRNALFLSVASFQVQLGGADTLVAGGGYTVVHADGAAGAAGDLVFGESGGVVFYGGATPDTVVGAAVTVVGGSAGIDAYGNGNLVAYGGAGYNIAASFTDSSETVQGGAGGGLLVGGSAGNNHLTANGGAAVIFGGGAGDQIDLVNAATDTVVMGGGPETVDATAAGAGDVIYGGGGGDLMLGGGGNDFLAAGTGNDTLAPGGGINGLLFTNGRAGGVDVVSGWDAGRDYVFLIGYGGGADAQAAASQVQSGGNTVVTLADHTQIWFMNTHGVGLSSFA